MDPAESEGTARQLLKVLVDAGLSVEEPVQNAWVQSEALRTLGLEGDALDAALTLAGEQGWIVPGPGPGTLVLTHAGLGTVNPME
jgi:catalase (peroxidase I)